MVTERIRSVRDLVVYKKAFDAAMRIFEISKAFPKEEKYSLTDQNRRSSCNWQVKTCRSLALKLALPTKLYKI